MKPPCPYEQYRICIMDIDYSISPPRATFAVSTTGNKRIAIVMADLTNIEWKDYEETTTAKAPEGQTKPITQERT